MVTTTRREPNPWTVGIIAGMSSYIDAAALVGIGIALAIYQFAIGTTPEQIGIASGVLTFCVAIGAVVGGRLGDTFGRRRVFLATMALIALGAALATFGTEFNVILVGVILVGLGVGADLPTALASASEAADDTNRGKIIGLSGVLWLVGIISAVGIASFAGGWGRLGAQILIGQVGVFAALIFVARLFVPESRSWLEQRQRRREGVVSDRPKSRVRDLLRAPYLVPAVALTVFYSLTNIGANTGGQFNSFIAVNYADTTVETYNQWALISLVLSIGAGILFMRVVDTKLRMPFFIFGGILIVVSYFVYAIAGFSLTTMVISLFLSAVGNSFAFQGIMSVWTQESFPTLLRSTAQGGVMAVARVVAALAATITPLVLQINASGGYVALGVLAAIGLLVGYFAFRGSSRNEFDIEEAAAARASAVEAPVVAK